MIEVPHEITHPDSHVIRKSFVMSVNTGAEAEYERRHNPIRPELERVLRAHGVGSYSIFLLPATGQLFAYVEIEDESQWAALAATPECKRWWQHMADLMPHNTDGSPIATELKEVFHRE
jgi:L-rhamnose mutarotase